MKLLVLTLLFGALYAAKDYRSQFNTAYSSFHVKDGLPTTESAQSKAERFKCFEAFAKNVDKINADKKLPYRAEKNFLSILTEAEQRSYLGFNATGHLESSGSTLLQRAKRVPTAPAASRDYSKKISGVKDQGQCGSCWTFGATAALEGEIYFTTGSKDVSLSEQEYMECSTQRDGCSGGWMKWCYAYSQAKDRIATTSAAPYKGRDSMSCNYGNVANALKITNTQVVGNIEISGDTELLAMADKHIISVAIYVNGGFMSYKNGIYVDGTCQVQPNHAVAVVGYGAESGRKFWKVRNSWGTGWGDAGHIKMDRAKQDMCHISTYSHIPDVKCRDNSCKAPDDDDKDDDKDDGDDKDGDDGDTSDWCTVRRGLGICAKNLNAAKAYCKKKDIKPDDCLIAKVKKCFYPPSPVDPSKAAKYAEFKIPCETECDAAAGMVMCNGVCQHKHFKCDA